MKDDGAFGERIALIFVQMLANVFNIYRFAKYWAKYKQSSRRLPIHVWDMYC